MAHPHFWFIRNELPSQIRVTFRLLHPATEGSRKVLGRSSKEIVSLRYFVACSGCRLAVGWKRQPVILGSLGPATVCLLFACYSAPCFIYINACFCRLTGYAFSIVNRYLTHFQLSSVNW